MSKRNSYSYIATVQYFLIWFTNGTIVIFRNKSLSPLQIDNNRYMYADISTVVLQSSSGQTLTKKKKQKYENSKMNFHFSFLLKSALMMWAYLLLSILSGDNDLL